MFSEPCAPLFSGAFTVVSMKINRQLVRAVNIYNASSAPKARKRSLGHKLDLQAVTFTLKKGLVYRYAAKIEDDSQIFGVLTQANLLDQISVHSEKERDFFGKAPFSW